MVEEINSLLVDAVLLIDSMLERIVDEDFKGDQRSKVARLVDNNRFAKFIFNSALHENYPSFSCAFDATVNFQIKLFSFPSWTSV